MKKLAKEKKEKPLIKSRSTTPGRASKQNEKVKSNDSNRELIAPDLSIPMDLARSALAAF